MSAAPGSGDPATDPYAVTLVVQDAWGSTLSAHDGADATAVATAATIRAPTTRMMFIIGIENSWL